MSRHKETKYSVVTSWRNWIARWTSNPTVAGSNPVEVGGDKNIFFSSSPTRSITTEHDWRSWQRVGLIILRSWVRSPHCALDQRHTKKKKNVSRAHYWRSR